MDQKLGSLIEKLINNQTYLSALPRDLKTLLYKYLFIDQPKIAIAFDELFSPAVRTYEREAALVIEHQTNTYYFKFDINYMRHHNDECTIDKYIHKVLDGCGCSIKINKVTLLTFSPVFGLYIFMNIIDPTINDTVQKSLVSQSKLYLTSNLLEALECIANRENV